jgi:acyl-CoA thioester hydrolase
MREYLYQLECAVRGYECDMQGHVNNAVYLNYLEHCRHEYLKSVGFDYATLVRDGLNLVVIRAEVDYKRSLLSDDRFVLCLDVERVSRLRFRFIQDIYLLPERQLILQAKVDITGVNNQGRPQLPAAIADALLG